ncbi:MAG: hypothetical protein LBV69_00035 [Bacteroidales bacterium]|jgi:hypothetical protein|nr:hypothetical protein [Bacteroidales bacterium]
MIFSNSYIHFFIFGFQEQTVEPTQPVGSWGVQIDCRATKRSENLQAKIEGNNYDKREYELLIDINSISMSEIVEGGKIKLIKAEQIIFLTILSVTLLESVQQIKIIAKYD